MQIVRSDRETIKKTYVFLAAFLLISLWAVVSASDRLDLVCPYNSPVELGESILFKCSVADERCDSRATELHWIIDSVELGEAHCYEEINSVIGHPNLPAFHVSTRCNGTGHGAEFNLTLTEDLLRNYSTVQCVGVDSESDYNHRSKSCVLNHLVNTTPCTHVPNPCPRPTNKGSQTNMSVSEGSSMSSSSTNFEVITSTSKAAAVVHVHLNPAFSVISFLLLSLCISVVNTCTLLS